MTENGYENLKWAGGVLGIIVFLVGVLAIIQSLAHVKDGVIYIGTPPSDRALAATKEAVQAQQTVQASTQQVIDATHRAEPTWTPVPRAAGIIGQTYLGSNIYRFYDAQAGVVCWQYDRFVGNGTVGGLSCLPISQTNLRPDDFGGGQ